MLSAAGSDLAVQIFQVQVFSSRCICISNLSLR
jgi:hypothetical protein